MAQEDRCNEGVQAFRQAVCVLLEECLCDVQARVSQIDMFSASSKRSGGGGGAFASFYTSTSNHVMPMEEDMLVRTVVPMTPSPPPTAAGQENNASFYFVWFKFHWNSYFSVPLSTLATSARAFELICYSMPQTVWNIKIVSKWT